MKTTKILTLILAVTMLFSLAACNQSPETINVYTLNGTTGFGMAKLMNDNAENEDYTFQVLSDASLITGALNSGEADIAALPTNAAANLYNKSNGGIQILAINTLGCLYLINGTGTPITSLEQLDGMTVHTPTQNPSFIFKHICEENNIDVEIVSTKSPADLSADVANGTVKLAVLPEPIATATIAQAKQKNNITLTNALDLTAEWDKIEDKGSLVQGCVVARKEFVEKYPKAVEAFLEEYKASIEYLNANVDEASQMIVDQGIFANATVAKKAVPKCNVAYLDGEDMKSAMQTYLGVLMDVAPKSIGEALPADDFYYIAK